MIGIRLGKHDRKYPVEEGLYSGDTVVLKGNELRVGGLTIAFWHAGRQAWVAIGTTGSHSDWDEVIIGFEAEDGHEEHPG